MISWPDHLRGKGRGYARALDRFLGGRLTRLRDRSGVAGPYRGVVEGETLDHLTGWAVDTRQPTRSLTLALYLGADVVARTQTGKRRDDVYDAGLGTKTSGFDFDLSQTQRDAIVAAGGAVIVRVLDASSNRVLGGYTFDTPFDGDLSGDTAMQDTLRGLLRTELKVLHATAQREVPILPESPGGAHAALFAPVHTDQPSRQGAVPIPGYLEYARQYARVQDRFDPFVNPDDIAHLLDWYLAEYGARRKGHRVPLSKELIAFCNQPITMGGQAQALTQVMWWRLLRAPHLLSGLDLNSPDWCAAFDYWWAHTEAPRLNIEDCMVPAGMRHRLCHVSASRRTQRFSISEFMERYHAEEGALQALQLSRQRDRMILALVIMVRAVHRPDLLNYLPNGIAARLLARTADAPSVFERFCTSLSEDCTSDITVAAYEVALRDAFYDLTSQRFLTRTVEGHRLQAAALPEVQGVPVDVQLIGPFKKASGLGQAARLSVQIMEHLDLDTNLVDFSTDNPTPEGYGALPDVNAYRPTKINLIHLNAELVPLAFAYEQNVFEGAYNIGYFFWELDKPAACHALSLSLLDEIWVSSKFGMRIYKQSTDKPVTNVGMSFETLPGIEREDGRAFLNAQFGFGPDQFVFFAAFDSYSFVQRKNPLGVLRAFQTAFQGVQDVRLVVKTQNRDDVTDPAQARIWAQISDLVAKDDRIHIYNQTLEFRDLLRLKIGCDCYISLHKAEGWGFGMLEAMNLGVPVIATAYSGNMDFCSDETAFLVDFEDEFVGPHDYIYAEKGHKWAQPDLDHAARQMKAVFSEEALRSQKAAAAQAHVRQHFSTNAIAQNYDKRLREILAARKGVAW